MKRINLLFVSAILLVSCTSEKKRFSEVDKIAVRWELRTNFTNQQNVFNAKFEITNNSDIALTDKNWTLFFNMAPRQIIKNETPQPAVLQHINGDWFKLTPEKNFSLQPGKSIAIDYSGVEAVIKETDRPLGLYFVFYDDNGAEEKIVEVTDYAWTPFTRPEQINRN